MAVAEKDREIAILRGEVEAAKQKAAVAEEGKTYEMRQVATLKSELSALEASMGSDADGKMRSLIELKNAKEEVVKGICEKSVFGMCKWENKKCIQDSAKATEAVGTFSEQLNGAVPNCFFPLFGFCGKCNDDKEQWKSFWHAQTGFFSLL